MQSTLGIALDRPPARGNHSAPQLLVELEPWHRSFLNNLSDFLLPPKLPPLHLTSRPAAFWPDVFVSRSLPWGSLRQSALYHAFLLTVVLTFPDLWKLRPQALAPARERTLTYYEVSEYLPSLNAGSAPAKVARKGKPAYSRQPVISIPPSPDNFSQTIVDPVAPKILQREAKLPNLVVWTPIPSPAPVAASARQVSKLTVPWLQTSVIAPTAENTRRKTATLALPKMPEPSVIEPAPSADVQRKVGELNIGNLEPTVAAPALPVPVQRAAAEAVEGVESAPPASAAGMGSAARAAGQLIALGLNPVTPTGPVELAGGSRRGAFAATPEGTPGAPGTPDIAAGGTGPGGTGKSGAGGPGSGSDAGNPSGVFIGGGPPVSGPVAVVAGTPSTSGPGGGSGKNGGSDGQRSSETRPRERIVASAAPPPTRLGGRESNPSSVGSRSDTGKIENQVFGPKRYYSMAINMPNLTSSGGSWIIRFAELKDDPDPGDLTAPSATSKVDPAYPAEMMRRGVEGRVTLYAVIHSDGSVGDVRVLRGFDDLLDENARAALLRWRFRPATKNGQAVDLEAVVEIPFMARKFSF